MRNVDAEYRWASAAFRSGRYDEAVARFEVLQHELPPFDGLSQHSMAAILEGGFSSAGVDLERAIECYRALAARPAEWGSVGEVGIARVLSRLNRCANQLEIETRCKRAIEIDGSIAASYFLGRMYEECRGDHRAARPHYLRMFRHGRPIGLRWYARSHMSYGSKVIGLIAHAAATLVSPALFLINRGRIIPDHDR